MQASPNFFAEGSPPIMPPRQLLRGLASNGAANNIHHTLSDREVDLGLQDGTKRDGIIVGLAVGAGILLVACILCLVIACHQRLQVARLRNRGKAAGDATDDKRDEDDDSETELGSIDGDRPARKHSGDSSDSLEEAVTSKTSPSPENRNRGATCRKGKGKGKW